MKNKKFEKVEICTMIMALSYVHNYFYNQENRSIEDIEWDSITCTKIVELYKKLAKLEKK